MPLSRSRGRCLAPANLITITNHRKSHTEREVSGAMEAFMDNRSSLTRRGFLRVGSLCPLGIGLAQFLQASRALAGSGTRLRGKAEACILLWLEGGPSQMDTWDPKANSGLKPIATRVPGIQ